MGRFTVKRSLKQLFIEKHAVLHMLANKEIEVTVKGFDRTVREVAEIQAEQALLDEILKDIEVAKQKINREIAEL